MAVTAPISPRPVIADEPDRLPAYVSNGMIGLRVLAVPLRPGLAMLNGLSAIHPVLGVEYSPQAPYPLAGDLEVNGVRLSVRPECARLIEQRYDFSCAELVSRFRFELDDIMVDVEVLTLASRSHPCLMLQEVAVEVSRSCELAMTALVATGGVPGHCVERRVSVESGGDEVADGDLRFEPPGALSTAGIAYSTELLGTSDAQRELADWAGNGDLATTYRLSARRGRRYRLRHLAAMVPSTQHQLADQHAVRLLSAGREVGFDGLRRRNAKDWEDLWLGRVLLLGADERWQAMSDAAFFYLNSSVHPSSPASTSIFGLARWNDYHYYWGHVMWDIEAFSIPPLLLSQPDAAEAMLNFRHRTAETAARNARVNGRRGIQFPWQAGPSHGEESAPLGAKGPGYSHHVTCVVANAFADYADATGDRQFTADRAWPVISGVADWVMSRTTCTPRGVEIKAAMGVAERPQPADNDAFTNMAAATVLRRAADMACALGEDPPSAWAETAARMVLGTNDESVIRDHDGYRADEDKSATPSALAGLLLFGHPVLPEVASATRRYYLNRADEYAGSPMLSALLGVFAAHEGDRQRSANLFEEGYAKFCSDRFANVHEYRADRFPDEPVAGPFYANLSGFLLACTYGLGHLRLSAHAPTSWCQPGPIVMPQSWEGVEIERIWARGFPHHFRAIHGEERSTIERSS